MVSKSVWIVFLTWLVAVYGNQLALLAGTLRTFQQHACDSSTLLLLCPNETTIDITIARYGRPQPSSAPLERDPCPPLPHHTPLDATKGVARGCEYSQSVNYKTLQLVVKACQHKQQCTIEVTPHTFSDTDICPNTRKYIEVAYKCRPKTFVNKVVCEGGELVIGCERDSRIAIYNVLFGRALGGSFACPQPEGVAEEDCQASYATEIVMRKCHGQIQCTILAKSDVFGSPCSPASNMYMKAVYTCVSKKILKQTQPTKEERNRGREEVGRKGGGEGSLNSPAAPPSPSSSSSSFSHLLTPSPDWSAPQHSPTTFYNPTITTWLSDKKSDDGMDEGRESEDGVSQGRGLSPSHTLPSPPSEAELINCTVLVLQGAQGREIGFLTEWMKAVAFVRGNFEKFLLYLLLGLFVGLVMFLFVVVGQLLIERRRAKKHAKNLQDPLTSVFAADIEDIDGDLDLDGGGGSVGGLGGGSPITHSPSPQDGHREMVRYNAYSTYGRRRDNGEETDGNPLSLTRTNNNQLFYN